MEWIHLALSGSGIRRSEYWEYWDPSTALFLRSSSLALFLSLAQQFPNTLLRHTGVSAAVLKAEQAAVFKFPLAPLGCSALLAAGSGLQGGSGPPHLPLELHLRGKLEPAGPESGGKAKKGRRSRTVFTELQLMGLEKRFEKQKYLSTPDRIDLAESLGLSQLQVKTWYQNRRMKWKKIVLQGGGLESPTKPKGRPKKNSIPTSEQLSEQERVKEVEKEAESLTTSCQVSQEE